MLHIGLHKSYTFHQEPDLSHSAGNGKRPYLFCRSHLMSIQHVGYLSGGDPLYEYFLNSIIPQMGIPFSDTAWKVFRFDDSKDVYLYEEKNSGIRLVGKFFKPRDPSLGKRIGETEFNNLLFLRHMGFSSAPHYVVRPFGFNPDINSVLVTEYLYGESLSSLITSALAEGRPSRLFRKLTGLGHFFATLHNRTAGEFPVNFDEAASIADRFVETLTRRWKMSLPDAHKLHHQISLWRGRSCMWEDRGVLVHGDATPSNILFGRGRDVMVIDLERMKWADRVFDLGCICGELKHFFFRYTGNPLAAEPLIGHFLWEYSCHFPDRDAAFRAITRRLPFYMALTLLRIARNSWVDSDYRKRLIREARQVLKAEI